MGVWVKEKQKSNRPKRHSPKSSRKWRSREWLRLQESRAWFPGLEAFAGCADSRSSEGFQPRPDAFPDLEQLGHHASAAILQSVRGRVSKAASLTWVAGKLCHRPILQQPVKPTKILSDRILAAIDSFPRQKPPVQVVGRCLRQAQSAEVPWDGVCGVERLQRRIIPEVSKNPTPSLARVLQLFIVCDAKCD
jgi:hypothetical protein